MCNTISNTISIEEFVNPDIKIIPSNLKKEENKMVKVSEIPNVQGFSIPLIRVLLKMLKNLEKKKKIFIDEDKKRISSEDGSSYDPTFTDCAFIAKNLLWQQLVNTSSTASGGIRTPFIAISGPRCHPKLFKSFIGVVEEFLAEFEEAEKDETEIERL